MEVTETKELARATVTLPKELLEEIDRLAKGRLGDRSTIMRQLLAKALRMEKIEEAVKAFQEGRISLGKAVETADLSTWEFLDILAERKIPSYRYPADEARRTIEKALREKGIEI